MAEKSPKMMILNRETSAHALVVRLNHLQPESSGNLSDLLGQTSSGLNLSTSPLPATSQISSILPTGNILKARTILSSLRLLRQIFIPFDPHHSNVFVPILSPSLRYPRCFPPQTRRFHLFHPVPQKTRHRLHETSRCALISFSIIVFIFQQIGLKCIIIPK